MYICVCHAVTDHAIRQAAEEGVRTMSELRLKTGCGSQCGSCARMARQLLKVATQAQDDCHIPLLRRAANAA